MRLSRRQLLQAALFGGAAGTLIGFERTPSGLFVPTGQAGKFGSMDANRILRHAISTKTKIRFGIAPAFAGPVEEETTVVTIKVMNHINTPLVFRLGQMGAGDDTTGPSQLSNGRLGTSAAFLTSKGIEKLPPNDGTFGRYRNLRFNNWFARMLHSGKFEGAAAGSEELPAGITDAGEAPDIAPFPPASEVAIQAFFGVLQSAAGSNHAYNNCGITGSADPTKGGDLSFHLSSQKVISSPLGIVGFNMGRNTEAEDVGFGPNKVLRADLKTPVAEGLSVKEHATTVSQAVGLGLLDENLVAEFDKLAPSPIDFTAEIKKNRELLKTALVRMNASASMETTTNAVTGLTTSERGALTARNDQSDQDATLDFLGQCKFTAAALDIPGKPFRNFNLFLHLVDIDGAPFDVGSAINAGVDGVSYVEGMRQLAVGLNVLAQAIKKHKNVYVVVVSEGGRSFAGADQKTSFSLLLGPGGPGNLNDFLYCDTTAVNGTGAFVQDPNDQGQALAITNGDLYSEAGVKSGPGVLTNNSILLGLVRHIEGKRGIPTTITGLGSYLKLMTG